MTASPWTLPDARQNPTKPPETAEKRGPSGGFVVRRPTAFASQRTLGDTTTELADQRNMLRTEREKVMLKCRCPNCGWSYSVPADITGKQVRCQKCRVTLLAKAIGGKTVLVLAVVDGDAPTQKLAPTVEGDPFAFNREAPLRRRSGGWGVVVAFGGMALAFLLIAGAAAWWRFRDSPDDARRALQELTPAKSRTPDVRPEKLPPAVEVDIADFMRRHLTNSAKFKKDFAGKRVKMRSVYSRVVARFIHDSMSDCLKITSGRGLGTDAYCLFDDPRILATLDVDKPLWVEGVVEVDIGEIRLLHCRVTSESDKPPPRRDR